MITKTKGELLPEKNGSDPRNLLECSSTGQDGHTGAQYGPQPSPASTVPLLQPLQTTGFQGSVSHKLSQPQLGTLHLL